jgi:hypothetical protein
MAFYPVVAKNAAMDDPALLAARQPQHERLLAAANAAMGKSSWKPLLVPPFVAWEVRVSGKWTPAESLGEGQARPEERIVSEVAGFRIAFYARPKSTGFSGPERVDLEILDHVELQIGDHVVARVSTRSWTDRRCSQTVVRPLGVRPELRIAVLVQTSGMTSHRCDGQEEKTIYHVVRF